MPSALPSPWISQNAASVFRYSHPITSASLFVTITHQSVPQNSGWLAVAAWSFELNLTADNQRECVMCYCDEPNPNLRGHCGLKSRSFYCIKRALMSILGLSSRPSTPHARCYESGLVCLASYLNHA